MQEGGGSHDCVQVSNVRLRSAPSTLLVEMLLVEEDMPVDVVVPQGLQQRRRGLGSNTREALRRLCRGGMRRNGVQLVKLSMIKRRFMVLCHDEAALLRERRYSGACKEASSGREHAARLVYRR